ISQILPSSHLPQPHIRAPLHRRYKIYSSPSRSKHRVSHTQGRPLHDTETPLWKSPRISIDKTRGCGASRRKVNLQVRFGSWSVLEAIRGGGGSKVCRECVGGGEESWAFSLWYRPGNSGVL